MSAPIAGITNTGITGITNTIPKITPPAWGIEQEEKTAALGGVKNNRVSDGDVR